jgi:hypothetical protein
MDFYWGSTMYVLGWPVVVGALLLFVLLAAGVFLGVWALLHRGRDR